MLGILGKEPHLGCTQPKFGEKYPMENIKMLGRYAHTTRKKEHFCNKYTLKLDETTFVRFVKFILEDVDSERNSEGM